MSTIEVPWLVFNATLIIAGIAIILVFRLWGDCMKYEAQLREQQLEHYVPTGDLEQQAMAWKAVWKLLQENGMPDFIPPRDACTGREQALAFVKHLIELSKIKSRSLAGESVNNFGGRMASDVDRWRAVLRCLGGSTVQNESEQYWSVKTPPAPQGTYRDSRAEFEAAIDAERAKKADEEYLSGY